MYLDDEPTLFDFSKMEVRALKPGRPKAYGPEIGEEICERLAAGEYIVDICKDEHMPSRRTVYKWQQDDADFREAYKTALMCRIEDLADECIKIADDGSHDLTMQGDEDNVHIVTDKEVIERTKIRIAERHFWLGKLLPARFEIKAGSQDYLTAPAAPAAITHQPSEQDAVAKAFADYRRATAGGN
jgi:hypothetical protein